jgi:hypothetical protein
MRGEYRWLALLGVAALAVVLFVVLRPGGGDNGDTQTVATTVTRNATTTTTTTTTAPAATNIVIRVEGGKPAGGVVQATVKLDSKVVLVVHSDVADEIHLHGYDKHVDVEAGGTARLPFTADIAGRFEAELESRSEKILDLTVEP